MAANAPHFPTDDVLMHHAARKESNRPPARLAAATMRPMPGGPFAMLPMNNEISLLTLEIFALSDWIGCSGDGDRSSEALPKMGRL